MTVTRRLVITGLVQGVWYRESMRHAAEGLSVTGWVRNRRDGSVEAVVQASAAQVEAIIEWCRQGPPEARVKDVAVFEESGSFSVFEKRPTE